MSGVHTTEAIQQDVVQTIERLHELTRISRLKLLRMASLPPSRYNRWRGQLLKPQKEVVPKRSSMPLILPEERASIIAYKEDLKRTGRHVSYRVQTYEMIDRDVAYVSESTVYRVLSSAGYLQRQETPRRKERDSYSRRLHTSIGTRT